MNIIMYDYNKFDGLYDTVLQVENCVKYLTLLFLSSNLIVEPKDQARSDAIT